MLKRTVAYLACLSLFLSSCVTSTGQLPNIGPKLSSFFNPRPASEASLVKDGPKLDVVIPVFDPNLPKETTDDGKQAVWPELRRAEAVKFAMKMKRALESTNVFGAVRVTPDQNSTGDLYILGKIEESNGEDVEISVKVVDITGSAWVDSSFDYRVEEKFHGNPRNQGKGPYDPVFDEAAQYIVDSLTGRTAEELKTLKSITQIRFAASFSEEKFSKYLGKSEGFFDAGQIKLVSMPANDDPHFVKTKALRVRDQLFVDNLQTHYEKFEGRMNEAYAVWQEQSLQEAKATREAEMKAAGQAVVGILAIGLAVAAAAAGARNNNSGYYDPTPTIAAVGAGAVGAAMLSESFKTSEEAKVYRDSLNELGQSIDLQMAPQVIEFEKKTVKLTGDAAEQFAQWRMFLKEIYQAQATPNKQL